MSLLFADRLPALVVDLAPQGVCVEMGGVFLPGSRVHGTLQLSGERVPFSGEVVWAQPGNPLRRQLSRVGIRFDAVIAQAPAANEDRAVPSGVRVKRPRRRVAIG